MNIVIDNVKQAVPQSSKLKATIHSIEVEQ